MEWTLLSLGIWLLNYRDNVLFENNFNEQMIANKLYKHLNVCFWILIRISFTVFCNNKPWHFSVIKNSNSLRWEWIRTVFCNNKVFCENQVLQTVIKSCNNFMFYLNLIFVLQQTVAVLCDNKILQSSIITNCNSFLW